MGLVAMFSAIDSIFGLEDDKTDLIEHHGFQRSKLTACTNPTRIREGGTKPSPGPFGHTHPVLQLKTEMGPGAGCEIKARVRRRSSGHGLCASHWSTWPLKDCPGETLLEMTSRPTISEGTEDVNNLSYPVLDGRERLYES